VGIDDKDPGLVVLGCNRTLKVAFDEDRCRILNATDSFRRSFRLGGDSVPRGRTTSACRAARC